MFFFFFPSLFLLHILISLLLLPSPSSLSLLSLSFIIAVVYLLLLLPSLSSSPSPPLLSLLMLCITPSSQDVRWSVPPRRRPVVLRRQRGGRLGVPDVRASRGTRIHTIKEPSLDSTGTRRLRDQAFFPFLITFLFSWWWLMSVQEEKGAAAEGTHQYRGQAFLQSFSFFFLLFLISWR